MVLAKGLKYPDAVVRTYCAQAIQKFIESDLKISKEVSAEVKKALKAAIQTDKDKNVLRDAGDALKLM